MSRRTRWCRVRASITADVSAALHTAILPPYHMHVCLPLLPPVLTRESCSASALTAALGGGSAGVGEFGDRYFCD